MKRSTNNFTIRLNEEIVEILKRLAQQEYGLSTNGHISEVIRGLIFREAAKLNLL